MITSALRFASIGIQLALFLFASVAGAQVTKTVINAGTITTYPPYESRNSDSNELVGFDIDIVNAIAAKMGVKVNWVESSFEQLVSFTSLKTGRVDVVVAVLADIPEHRASVSFLDYMFDNSVFFTTRVNAQKFLNMSDLCGKRVAITRAAFTWNRAAGQWSDDNCVKLGKKAITVVGTNGSPDSLLQLNQGRVDATVQGAAILARQNSLEGNRYITIGAPFVRITGGIGFSRDEAQFGQSMKSALNALIADGTYQSILRKWKMPEGTGVPRAMINGQP